MKRILAILVIVMVGLSISVGVLLFRDQDRIRRERAERDEQFALVCHSIVGLREGIISAFGNLGTNLEDPAIVAELERLRRETDCVRS